MVEGTLDVESIARGRRPRNAGKGSEGLRCGDRLVRFTVPDDVANGAGDLGTYMSAEFAHLAGPGRIAAKPVAGQPASAERERDRDIRLLVDAGGDLK